MNAYKCLVVLVLTFAFDIALPAQSQALELYSTNVFIFTNHASVLAGLNRDVWGRGVVLAYDCFYIAPESVTNLISEIKGSSFRKLVSDADPLQDDSYFCECITVEKDYFWLDLFVRQDVNPDALRRLRQRVKFYVAGRLSGHTTNYLYQAIDDIKKDKFSTPIGWPPYLTTNQWVPSTWTNVFAEDGYWVVCDGGYAWLYDKHGLVEKRDAKEYIPELKTKFKSAREQAIASLKSRGYTSLDSHAVLDSEMQKILKRDFHIDWLTPGELIDRF